MSSNISRALRDAAGIGFAAFIFVALAAPAQANTSFTNGNFSQVGSATKSFSIDLPADAPNNVLTAWTVTPTGSQTLNCLVIGNSNTNICGSNAEGGGQAFWVNPGPSPDGGNYVAIDGDQTYSTSLNQTITGLVVGQTYAVGFYQAAAQQTGFNGDAGINGKPPDQWTVSLGAETHTAAAMIVPSHTDAAWNSQALGFTATATSEVLSFVASGPAGEPPFVLLDGVTFTATPEPATLALLGAGLVGIAVAGRLRKRSKRQ